MSLPNIFFPSHLTLSTPTSVQPIGRTHFKRKRLGLREKHSWMALALLDMPSYYARLLQMFFLRNFAEGFPRMLRPNVGCWLCSARVRSSIISLCQTCGLRVVWGWTILKYTFLNQFWTKSMDRYGICVCALDLFCLPNITAYKVAFDGRRRQQCVRASGEQRARKYDSLSWPVM